VVGRRYRDGVDVLPFLVEHLAVIAKPFGLGVVLKGIPRHAPIHVAQSVDVFGGDAVDVAAAFSPAPDARDVEFVAGRGEPAPQYVPWHDGESGTHRQVIHERPSEMRFRAIRCLLTPLPRTPASYAFAFAGLNTTANTARMTNAPIAGTSQIPASRACRRGTGRHPPPGPRRPSPDEVPDAVGDEIQESLRGGPDLRAGLLVGVDLAAHEEEVVADTMQQDAGVNQPHPGTDVP
jgi:hypothetical protein